MTSWLTLTPEGETAIRLLNRLRVMVSTSRASFLSQRNGALLRDDLNDLAIVRAWSILEAYLHDRGEVITKRELPIPSPRPALAGYLYDRTENSFRGSFPKLKGYWEEALGVPVGNKAPGWQRLTFYHLLRNLIVHSVAEIQLSGEGLKKALQDELRRRLAAERRKPVSERGRFPISDSDFDELADLVIAFVLWADTERP